MRLQVTVCCLACISAMVFPIHAEIPLVISYQGKVTDSGGSPVADGTYTMQFRIYDAVTGGNLEWDSGAQSVDVIGAVLSVFLGESPQPTIYLPFDEDYWLLVTVEGDDQTPRQRLGSVGYSYMASGLVAGTKVSGSVTSGTLAALKATNTATSGTTYGVYGRSNSADGIGLYGQASATSGTTYGVYGQSSSTACFAVYGYANATSGTTCGGGFQSSSPGGSGVAGWATAISGSTYGVFGRSNSSDGIGMYGYVSSTTGSTYGVYGWSSSTSGHGVFGGATATSGVTCGVYGYSASSIGYGVYYTGGLAGSGPKSCVVKTSKGPTLLYCQESPENWFEDFGEGQLVNGRCHIELDPLFLETVTIDDANPMKVFVQPQDPTCKGVAAIPGENGFDVVELWDGHSDGKFTYRVVAKRKGFEEKRLDYCKAAENDSYLYPELREKELREREEEQARIEEERRLRNVERERMNAEAAAALR